MGDEYDNVARGKLKLKTDSNNVNKKKKKKNKKNREKMDKQYEDEINKYESEKTNSQQRPTMTKAEMAFKKMQAKIVRISVNKIIYKITYNNNTLFYFVFIYSPARETDQGKSIPNT